MDDLQSFLSVARQLSFTRAAADIGVTPSALSHTIKSLEEKLGYRLLTRTTRSVALTEEGETLLNAIGPLYEQIHYELDKMSALRGKPTGTIRLTCSDDVVEYLIRPILAQFLETYPDIQVEVSIDYGFTDIVRERIDAGIRLGESVDKDMIAVRISRDWRLSAVATPAYFAQHPAPDTPQDLIRHNCINIRHSASSGVYAWEFEQGDRHFTVKTTGQFTANSTIHQLNAALDGIGIAYLPDYLVEPHLISGKLVEVLADWSPTFQGFHLYYPHRRQGSPAFMAFVNTLRYKGS
ncbi:LysR family transcriptional regulator [Pantoea cypripedii]|uniref:LysR family transcriptional regulator n=1 Tax=Pantoea cypripedii TaxID=55209 RepID=A0A6B9G4J4_PANCY|nr:LysR family transcriptional regulator [Pantoea cypripedii]QGY32434.1 LysR family transcriptional regulator [Pantoea cypripedii]